MDALDLTGAWELMRAGDDEAVEAVVPGCVHTDLLAAGAIADPFYRDNEQACQWIGEVDWVYARTFEVPAELLARDRVLLRCEGLDTLATVRLNGRVIGRADNMFRTWEFDAAGALRAGTNRIQICFASTRPYIRKRSRERTLPEWAGDCKIPGGNWVRKMQCNYGWDWGPMLLTCGIWRDISLVAYDSARLTDVHVDQQHHAKAGVTLTVTARAEKTRRSELAAAVSVSFAGRCIAEATVPVRRGKAVADLAIPRPKLWWPAGMGAQPLYDVTVDLLVWLELAVGGEVVSTNLSTFTRPKHLDLPQAGIVAHARSNRDGTFEAAVTAERPALWAWLELTRTGARFSDNFFHLRPGQETRITIEPAGQLTLAEVKKQLRIRSLVDTY